MTKQLVRNAAAAVVMTTAMAWNVPAFAQMPMPSRTPAASSPRASSTARPATATNATAPAAPAPASGAASAPPPAQSNFGPSAGPESKPRP